MRLALVTRCIAFLLFLFVFLPLAGSAQSVPERYEDFKKKDFVLVYDYAQVLDDNKERFLNERLNALKDSTSNVIVVITHPDFRGDAPYSFASTLGHQWGVGTEKDNGVVVVGKRKVGNAKGEVFIATGYGLEGVIPDAIVNRIIDNEMIPSFKKNDYYGGIALGVEVIGRLATGEIKEYVGNAKKSQRGFPWILFLFIGFAIFSTLGSQAVRAQRYARLNDMTFWAAWILPLRAIIA